MIDITKKYKTRDGQEVTQLVKYEISGPYVISGVIGNANLETWTKDGEENYYIAADAALDLIEVKPEQWHFIYKIGKNSGLIISRVTYESDSSAELASYRFSKDYEYYKFLGAWKLPQEQDNERSN